MIELGVAPDSVSAVNSQPLDLRGRPYSKESFGLFTETIDPMSLFTPEENQSLSEWKISTPPGTNER